MKKRVISILLALCMVFAMFPVAASAATVASGKCGTNLTWTLDGSGKLTISGKGAMTDFDDGNAPWSDYDAKAVKTVVIGSGVTTIGNRAFIYCSELTSATIPSTVTSIGDCAFRSCGKLTSVSIPSSVTSIGESAFQYCTSLPSVVIPNSVTSMGEFAFCQCWAMTGVTISSSLTGIGEYVFSGCSNLTAVTIPNGVRRIGGSAFSGCSKLKSVSIPNSVYTIGERAFCQCYALTGVSLPDSVTDIGAKAFEQCSALTSVKIPSDVQNIAGGTFMDCTALTSVTIPNGVVNVYENAFKNCSSLTDITLPESLRVIGAFAFEGCSSLTEAVIPSGTLTIGTYAFTQCRSLTSVTIPASVERIGAFAFLNSGVKTVVMNCDLGEGVDGCFYGVTADVYYPKGNATYTEGNRGYCEGTINWIPYSASITYQPISMTVSEGSNVQFNLFASGTKLTYQWQYKTPTGKTWTNTTLPGAKTAALTVPATAARNGCMYRCVVTDASGAKLYSSVATLTVETSLAITTQPAGKTVAEGATAKFTVAASGTGLTYQWQYQMPGKTTWTNTTLTGAKTSLLTVPAAMMRNGCKYRCVITDAAGTKVTSNAATLTVKALKITGSPLSKTVAAGTNAQFGVIASGVGLTYQWQYQMPGKTTWTNTTLTGAKTSLLTVPATAARNGCKYRCVVTDAAGTVRYTNAATLTVK